jgi:hypothetical protein
MKIFTTFLIFIFSIGQCSQETALSKHEEINLKMSQIDEALIAKDTSALGVLLHNDLTLGHSNGWLETKSDLQKTLIEEGVLYRSIELIGEPEIHFQSGHLISTRRDINVNGIFNSTPFEVKLNVLELWIYENGNWQLLARQSVNRRE